MVDLLSPGKCDGRKGLSLNTVRNVDKTEAAAALSEENTCKSLFSDELQIGVDCLIMLLI